MTESDSRNDPETEPQDLGRRPLTPAAERALAEAEERRRSAREERREAEREVGGRGGLDPARYGDWEKDGIASDF